MAGRGGARDGDDLMIRTGGAHFAHLMIAVHL